MTEIFEKLSVIGDSIDEEDRVVHLASLSDSYNMLVIALEVSQVVPKWALVNERLLFEETKIKERDFDSATELKAMTSKQVKRGPKCYHCGRNDHINGTVDYCMKTQKKIIRSTQRRKPSSVKKMYKASPVVLIDYVGFLTHHALTSNVGKNNWIVESGATCHMSHDARNFVNLKI